MTTGRIRILSGPSSSSSSSWSSSSRHSYNKNRSSSSSSSSSSPSFSSFAARLLMLGILSRCVRMSSSLSAPSQTEGTGRGGLIFLHGLGDTPAGWSSLQFQFPSLRPNLKDVVYVFPPAPTIPISINGGMTMPGWFDLYDWPVGVGIKDDRDGMMRAVEQIETAANRLERDHGITRDRIVVGGFSQGGAIAMLTAYYNREGAATSTTPFAGCLSLSGWLPLSNEAGLQSGKLRAGAAGIPLYWGHGKYDDKVLYEQQAFGIGRLREAGVDKIEHESFPMGHESHPKEIQNAAKFVDDVLFGSDAKKDKNESEL